jgi:DNA-binding HxlR family transcriptional regulator
MQQAVSRSDLANPLARLCARTWSLRVLDLLNRRSGARFVELAYGTGASRPRLTAALEALVEAGLVMRNPGYGHPLRPEYILTERGRNAAEPAAECLAVASRWKDHAGIIHRKWPLPILGSIGENACRFSALRHTLPGATARALSLTLAGLSGAGLVRRDVVDSSPPLVLYRVAKPARPILPPARHLAAALTATER